MSAPRLIQTSHLPLHARVQGDGPPLLFLGGSNFDLSIRALVFDSALTKHFTVAAADPRGLGKSAKPAGSWNMQDYAADAIELMDALGWSTACVLGESFGAMVAMELALMAPDRIVQLGLAAGAPGGLGGSSYPIHDLLHISNPRARAIQSLSIQDSRFTTLLIQEPEEAEARITLRLNNDEAFLNHSSNATGYPRLLATRACHDCWDRLASITTPTLIIAGKFDNQAPLDRAESMQVQMPQAELAIFDNGHNVLFATPAPVDTIIERWMG